MAVAIRDQHLKDLHDVQGRCNQDLNVRSVTIMITDSCPECEADHLDLQACLQKPAVLPIMPACFAWLKNRGSSAAQTGRPCPFGRGCSLSCFGLQLLTSSSGCAFQSASRIHNDGLGAQALTFLKMAPADGGKIDIKYRRVNCVPPKDLSVLIDNNRGQGGWLRLQITVRHTCMTLLQQSDVLVCCSAWHGRCAERACLLFTWMQCHA